MPTLTAPDRRVTNRSRYRVGLTEQEVVVLYHMMMGRKYHAIAREIGITDQATKQTSYRLFNKLGANNRIEAVKFGIARGVLNQYCGFWGS